jgi:flagellar basal body-associated protein FliL
MSEETEQPEAETKKKPGLVMKLLSWGVIFAMGAGAGAAAQMLTGAETPEPEGTSPGIVGVKLMDLPEPNDEIGFVDFEEVVANLNDPRQSRYLTCSISLQVSKPQVEAITLLLEEKNALLKNWLLAHMRDKTLEEVRGKYGHNLLRREIHGKFNELLFTDGIERVQDVLFRDIKTQ